jgi:hypothetical protein
MVDTWTLSDGTTVSLGGIVTGDSILAEVLRSEMQTAKGGEKSSGYGAVPHIERLDVNVPYLLDYYLRDQYEVTSGPNVVYPQRVPRPAPPKGAVY